MKTIEERLAHIEGRIDRLERLFRLMLASKRANAGADKSVHTAAPLPTESERVKPQAAPERPAKQDPWQAREGTPRAISVTHVLGWTGATALVLAMAYLIRLAIDVGWLTPARRPPASRCRWRCRAWSASCSRRRSGRARR